MSLAWLAFLLFNTTAPIVVVTPDYGCFTTYQATVEACFYRCDLEATVVYQECAKNEPLSI